MDHYETFLLRRREAHRAIGRYAVEAIERDPTRVPPINRSEHDLGAVIVTAPVAEHRRRAALRAMHAIGALPTVART